MKTIRKSNKSSSIRFKALSIFIVLCISISLVLPIYKVIAEGQDPFSGKYFMIKSRYSGLYFDVEGGSVSKETKLIQYTKNNPMSKNQIFQIVKSNTDGYYKIVDSKSGLVLDLRGNNNNKNEQVIIYSDNGQDNQLFRFDKQNDGAYKIRVKHSGQYLTIKSDSKDKGASVVQWPYKTSGADNQAWYLEEVKLNFNSVDEYLSFQVIQNNTLNIKTLVQEAKNYGFVVSENTVKDKVNSIINNQQEDKVFTDRTGFITTYGMLNKSLNEITLAMAHNAFSNNKDRRSSFAWDTYKTGKSLGTENHNISIKTMLDVGYRVIDLDIGDNGNGNTGAYHRYRLSGYTNLNGKNAILPKMKEFLNNNPSEFLVIYLSDVYNGTINLLKLKDKSLYRKGDSGWYKQVNNLLADMKDVGLLDMVYNYHGDNSTSKENRYSELSVPGKNSPYPVLKDMIQTNKRVIFLERDAGVTKDIGFNNVNNDPNKATKENLALNDNLINDLKGNSSNRLINISCMYDWGAAAGDYNAAKINNNGRRIYDIFKKANSYLSENGLNRIVNSVNVDYATGNKKQGGYMDVSPVDAVNRLNFNNLNYNWNINNVGKWYWN